jgi:hypothetical protein
MHNQNRMFALYLIEDEFGQVRVFSDYSGAGERALALGIEIMQSLRDVEPFTEGQLSIAVPTRTNTEH